MRLLIFGASGKAGRVVVDEALARGHEVVAFVHHHAPVGRPGLSTAQGDVHDPASVQRALAGCDAVISCLSSWGTPHKNVLASAMRSIIPTMEAAGVRRIVTLTGNIAQAPKESFTIWNQLVHGFLAAAAPQVAQDAESHMQLLANSALDWTAVRSPAMVNGSNAAYRLTDTVSIWGTIPRKAVAASILDLVASRDYIGKAPLVRRRSD